MVSHPHLRRCTQAAALALIVLISQGCGRVGGAKGPPSSPVQVNQAGAKPDRVATKPPGEPSPSSASAATLRQRLDAVASYSQLAATTQGLSSDEKAGLEAIVRVDPRLNARLLPLANTVVSVASDSADAAAKERFGRWVGRAVTPDMLVDLREYCMARCRAGERFICLLARDKCLGGCRVTVKEQDPSELPAAGRGVRPKGVYALVCAPGVYATASWRIAPLPDSPGRGPFVTFEASNSDDLQAYEQALAEVFGPRVEATSIALVKFQAGGFE